MSNPEKENDARLQTEEDLKQSQRKRLEQERRDMDCIMTWCMTFSFSVGLVGTMLVLMFFQAMITYYVSKHMERPEKSS